MLRIRFFAMPRLAGALAGLLVAGGMIPLCASDTRMPDELASCFRPPAQFLQQSDRLRSPLLRPDGSRITSREDWAAERIRIRQRWFELMGPWPPLITAPRYEEFRSESRENFEQRFVRIEVAPGHLHPAILLVPQGAARAPAVIVPYYDAETGAGLGGSPLRDFGYQLARRGFVALCIGRPERGASNHGTQPLSFLAYMTVNCHTALGRMPAVDARRIGIVGHSFGGKWALFASCLYDQFACGVWSDPGIVFDEARGNVNYWEPWYLGFDPDVTRPRGLVRPESPRTGAYKRMIELGHDLHELHALMAPRPFLVSGGAEDTPQRWKSLQHAIEVNRLYGVDDRVGMHNRPAHAPTEESNAMIYRFLEYVLMPAQRTRAER